jgi:hypothetical protein
MNTNEEIINLIENNKIREAYLLFSQNIRRMHHMNDIVYLAFSNNKFNVGKELINFNFIINNQGYQYNYSPFDFFCHVCKNDYIDILFKIIEEPYFWNKDRIIFEPEYKQTPRQWLIATAGYILCSLNKVKSVELLCDKYNITKFDADQSKFFDIAAKNNFEELINFLVNRYGSIIYEPMNGICETSLYDLPTFDRMRKPIVDEINNVPNISVGNPMYLDSNKNDQIYQSVNKNNNMSIDNPLYNAFYNPINNNKN